MLQLPVTSDSFWKSNAKNEHVIQGLKRANEICKWLFSEENNGAPIFCYNFKGYDSHHVLQYLHDNAVLPEVITTVSEYMTIDVSDCNIRMINSLTFIPMP